MFDTARALVLVSLPEGLSAAERRARLCERFYGTGLAQCYPAAVERSLRGERGDVSL